MNYLEIFIGAIIGSIFSFVIFIINEAYKIKKFKKYINTFLGDYNVKRYDDGQNKNNQLEKVKIEYGKDTILKLTLYTKKNGLATGSILINKYNYSIGEGLYFHVDEDKKDLSGIVKILLISPDNIHIFQTYIDKNFQERSLKYILEKQK